MHIKARPIASFPITNLTVFTRVTPKHPGCNDDIQSSIVSHGLEGYLYISKFKY